MSICVLVKRHPVISSGYGSNDATVSVRYEARCEDTRQRCARRCLQKGLRSRSHSAALRLTGPALKGSLVSRTPGPQQRRRSKPTVRVIRVGSPEAETASPVIDLHNAAGLRHILYLNNRLIDKSPCLCSGRRHPRWMDPIEMVAPLSALAQPTRLAIFVAIAAEADGLNSTDVAERTATPRSNTSTHLNILRHAGLVTATRSGREIRYRAERGLVESISSFLRDAVAVEPHRREP